MMYPFKKTHTKGFTLIEMMVSIALFSIVMVIVATAYLNLLNLDREAKATNDVTANLNFVMDTMSRSIRTGTHYSCVGGGANCGGPQSSFSFIADDGVTYVAYALQGGNIVECTSSSGSCSPSTPINDPSITVDNLSFYVKGVDTGNSDGTEPQVTMVIIGHINIDPNHAPVTFDIQTSATQRQIDI